MDEWILRWIQTIMAAFRILLLLSLFGASTSQMSACSYTALINHLNLTSSNQLLSVMRPVRSWKDSTLVKVDMVLLGILDVDEKLQAVTIQIGINMSWTNQLLTWNSSDFCELDMLTLPRSMVWIPDVIIQEDVSDTASIREDPLLTLNAHGLVHTQVSQRLSYICQLNIYWFPFDIQQCNITFSSMNSNGKTISLAAAYNDTLLTAYSVKYLKTHGEWKLINLKVLMYNHSYGDKFWSKLSYTVTLERKPFLYIINLIVPLCFLLFLDLSSFFIDESKGEKLGFKVTILLSISVLLLILQDMLPSTEENLPMIAQYFIGVFTMMWMSLLETMLVGFLRDLDANCGKEAGSSVDVEMDDSVGEEENDADRPEKNCDPADPPCLPDLLKHILDKVTAVGQEVTCRRKEKKNPGCYRLVAKIIDTFFFVASLIVVVVFLLSVALLWSQRGRS